MALEGLGVQGSDLPRVDPSPDFTSATGRPPSDSPWRRTRKSPLTSGVEMLATLFATRLYPHRNLPSLARTPTRPRPELTYWLTPAPLDDHRRVGGSVPSLGPSAGIAARQISRPSSVQGDEGGLLAPGDDHAVAVHQGRLAELPAGHHGAAEVAARFFRQTSFGRGSRRRGRCRCRGRRGRFRPRWAARGPRTVFPGGPTRAVRRSAVRPSAITFAPWRSPSYRCGAVTARLENPTPRRRGRRERSAGGIARAGRFRRDGVPVGATPARPPPAPPTGRRPGRARSGHRRQTLRSIFRHDPSAAERLRGIVPQARNAKGKDSSQAFTGGRLTRLPSSRLNRAFPGRPE